MSGVSGSDRSTFVGRTQELEMLDGALAAARDGSGRIVLLVGDPGIGKTRLTEEFSVRAREAGIEVLGGRCFEGPGAPAFWPWMQIVRAYAGARDAETLAAELGAGAADVAAVVREVAERLAGLGAPPSVGEAQARFRFFDALTRAFGRAAGRRPIAIVLDDLHGADPSSLLLLQFLAREVRGMGVVVVGTLRPVALTPAHPLAETMGELVREQVSLRLELRGLDRDQVAELMARMGGEPPPAALADQVHARTEGNPLYVTEVVRMLLARDGFASGSSRVAIPTTVRMAIGRHLGALSAAARETLRLAALFGREFRAEVVARAEGRPIATVLAHLDEAVEARAIGPLTSEPGRYRFAHALFGETLTETLGEASRVALHRRAASALAAGPNAGDVVPEIAHHWIAAGPGGDPAAAVEWARRAGERAFEVLAYEEAARWYRQAIAALGWLDRDVPELRTTLLLGLGGAAKRVGAIEEAKVAFEKAADIARALGSAELLTRAALGYAPVIAWGEQAAPDPPVVALLEESIAAWHGRESPMHAGARVRLGMAMLFGDAGRRDALLTSGLDMARRLGDDAALRDALAAALSSYHARFDFERRLEVATELVRRAEQARDLEALAVGRLWRCVHLLECGDVAASRVEVGMLAALADELRQPAWHWQVGVQRVVHALMDGKLEHAEVVIRETAEIGRHLHTYAAPTYFAGHMFFLGMLRGEPDPSGYRAVFDTHPDPVSISPVAWAEAERGQVAEAQKILTRLAVSDFAAIRGGLIPPVAAMFLAEACAVVGDAAYAARLEEFLAPCARFWIIWAEGAPLGPVALALGLVARTTGRFDEAAKHFEYAIAECRRVGAPAFLARALYEYAMLLQARAADGDGARAAELAAEARAVAAAIGMRGIERKAAALLPAEIDTRGPSSARSVCRREGDYWVVSYGGTTIRLRDARGLHYLAALLQHPGREFHATALVGGTEAGPPGTGAAAREDGLRIGGGLDDGGDGLAVDARAQRAYRERMEDLAESIAEAERTNDLGRRARAGEELAALREQLAAAGRGDRSRTHGERARLTVTKGIGAALARIEDEHPSLGAHLRATVRRGYFCAYVPDPRHPIRWES